MAVTKRGTKGTQLTQGEIDANWDELIGLLTRLGIFEASQTPGVNNIVVVGADGNIKFGGRTLLGASSDDGVSRLQVLNTSTVNSIATFYYNAASPVLKIRMDGNGNTILDAPGGGVAGGRMCFHVTGSEKMRIAESTGNVLIGTSTDAGTGKLQVSGDSYFSGDVSAATFTDRTPFYDGDAITEIRNISGIDGKIDHSTLPEFAQKDRIISIIEKRKCIVRGKEEFEYAKVGEKVEPGRDLGAMISILTKAVKQLDARVAALEERDK